jgi:hypothetical protein
LTQNQKAPNVSLSFWIIFGGVMPLLTVGRFKEMLAGCDDSLILRFRVYDHADGVTACGEVEDSQDGIRFTLKHAQHVGTDYPDMDVLRIDLEVD